MVQITKAKVVPDLEGWLLIDFDDHKRKLVNVKPHMQGVLKKLEDPNFFKKVFVDEELNTVSWPGELDLDPDNLYEQGISVELVEFLVDAVKRKPKFAEFIEEQRA